MGNSTSRRSSRARNDEQRPHSEALPAYHQNQQQNPGHQRPYNNAPYLPPPSFPVANNQSQPAQQPPVRQSNVHHTTTVRNLVNLKKQSLTLTPRKDDPDTLDISFTIDAVQECIVSIFFLAKEDRKTGHISAQQVVCANVKGKSGMNMQFPFEGMDLEQSCLRTTGIAPDTLHSADMGSFRYPLIIRLETLADKAVASQHSLDSRTPGEALVSWVQSQTTCAVLGDVTADADEENCKVLRQRIWVHELFYDLQEIYGITEANQAANSDGDFSAECVVCLTNRKNTTVLPCRHFCMCAECAKALLRRTRTCPMCRLPISSVLQIQIQQNTGRQS